jgi:undecaprenyl-diphosphatase
MFDWISGADEAILLFVQENLRTPALTAVMKTVSRLGDAGIVWIVLGILLLFFAKTRRGGGYMLASLAVEYALCDLVIKKLVLRPRPYLVIQALELLVKQESSTSFPSGHSASSFVCAYILTRCFGKKGAWSYVLATFIALSRIYVGVHYPSDVVAGVLLGTVIGVVMYALLRRFLPKKAA